jgi:hypothetical protein
LMRIGLIAMTISSPFAEGEESPAPSDSSSASEEPAAGKSAAAVIGPLDLTLENVELVLDEMRPYLIADGGNVAVRDIDNGVIQLELQACVIEPGSTPLSVSLASHI